MAKEKETNYFTKPNKTRTLNVIDKKTGKLKKIPLTDQKILKDLEKIERMLDEVAENSPVLTDFRTKTLGKKALALKMAILKLKKRHNAFIKQLRKILIVKKRTECKCD